MVTRADVINTARLYMDTRFHHQGRSRAAGVDCIGLIICTLWDLGIIPRTFNVTGYGRRPIGKELYRQMRESEYLEELPNKEYQPGDILLMSFKAEPQHVVLVTDQGMIHSYASMRRVVEHGLDDYWKGFIESTFQIRGIE